MAEEDHKSMKADDVEEVDVDLDFDDDDESTELKLPFEHVDKGEELVDDDDDDQVFEKVEEMKLPEATSWIDPDTGKTVHGVEVMMMKHNRKRQEDTIDVCSICARVWNSEQNHQMSCLPCGHVFGMSCIRLLFGKLERRLCSQCPQCYQLFTSKDVWLLYATRLRIPVTNANQKAPTRRFRYNKQGFAAFKQYEWGRLTHALKNRGDALLERDTILRSHNYALKRRAELLKRMAGAEKRVKALGQQADALSPADASRCRADALRRRADVMRCRADALQHRADKYLSQAHANQRQAKGLLRQAKALRRRIDAYKASIMFFKQSYKELHGFAR